jgi:hypothetical protein
MEITSISKPPASGNHGRSSAEPAPLGIGNLVASTTPQQSTRNFVAPAVAPVRKTPDIADIIREKGESNDEMMRRLDDEMINNNGELSSSNHLIPTSSNHLIPTSSNHLTTPIAPTFSDSWHTMFEQIFASVPTIYFSLKETLPELENNIIKVVVKNDIQKEHFEAKIRDALAVLRTHYDEKIEDIVVETNEKLETKKIIYDVKDKLQNFKEQNEEFEDFLQILDLTIKD